MPVLKQTSLGDQVAKKMSIWILVLIITITIGIFSISYLLSKQMFNQQVNIWNSVTPQNTLSNLMDSDYFSIKKEVKFLESTRLFSSFIITDNQKRTIAGFGIERFDPSRLTPIKDEAKVIWGYYSFTTNFYKFFSPFLIAIAIFAALVFILYFFIRWRIRSDLDQEFSRFNRFLKEIEQITESLPDIYNEKNTFSANTRFSHSAEQEIINRTVARLFEEIRKANKSLREAILEAEQQKFQEELTRTALQVAHDIGSPLAVLETILQSDLFTLSEEIRIAVRNAVLRIRDITNSLLKKAKQDLLSLNEESLSQQLLYSLINLVVAEKRLQYQASTNIQINFEFNESAYDLFAMIKIADFSRIISNVINNSVEALNDAGQVWISLSSWNNYAVVSIEDNGKGIPETILTKLGKLGVTHGKPKGLGLGLYHAKQTVESWGGFLEIQSELNKGTTIKIYLPKTKPPTWFIPAIILNEQQQVIIVDDDESIHAVWRERFKQAMFATNKVVTLNHFYSPSQLTEWQNSQSERSSSALYLCDYEFVGSDENGIDLITRLKINYLSILVTSRFNSEEVTTICEAKRIRLLPKDVASFIPLEIR